MLGEAAKMRLSVRIKPIEDVGTGETLLTLIKPPSGLARRKRGWLLVLGRKSEGPRTLRNSGTGPRGAGMADTCRRGDLGSAPKSASGLEAAEEG